jgi:hypothetical protein
MGDDLLYTGDTVQADGDVGRVLCWRVGTAREYLVRFPDGREAWYARPQVTLLRKLVVERRPHLRGAATNGGCDE